MARKGIVPPGFRRGGRGKRAAPPAPNGKGKAGGNGKTPPPVAARGVAKGAPLPSPPPRKRTTPGMPPLVQNPTPVMRGPVIAVHIPTGAEERAEGEPMGPAMSAGVAGSPKRRAAAQAMRGGRMAF